MGGWRAEGELPDLTKMVIIAAPHSSNWDFVLGIGLLFALRLDVRFIGKAELFRWPLGWLMRFLGGIPVERSQPEGIVEEAIRLFRRSEKLLLAIAPEGTRKPVERWKTGFYRIALGAGVPIVTGYFDNGRRVLGFGGVLRPSGDADGDVARLREFYAGMARR